MYLPDKVFIKPQSKSDPATAEIVRRLNGLDPDIQIINMRGMNVSYPASSSAVWRWKQKKKNLILAHRTVPFLTTFASPGNIVERMGVILNLSWQCPSNCQFCYLQSVLPQDHTIYTNIEDLNRQISIEPFVHRSVLSLWTILSFARKEELRKVPPNFKQAADYLRKQFIKENVNSKTEAVELLEEILGKKVSPIFKILQGKTPAIGFTASDLRIGKKSILEFYEKNSKYLPRISAAEFTDIIAYDHLTGYSNVLMDQISQVPDIELTVRTKSAYVDEMVKHDGDDRVTLAINFNTPYAIEHYEQGTASLEDRILAAQKVQAARNIRLGVVIEPVIKYPGYEKDYVDLATHIIKSLDTNRISDVAMSCVRYSGRVEKRIIRNFPTTDLFDDSQGLVFLKNDRLRYPLEERTKVYQMMFNEFRKHTKAYLRLGAETPDAWKDVGLDASTLMDKSVYQYNLKDNKTMAKKTVVSKEPEESPIATFFVFGGFMKEDELNEKSLGVLVSDNKEIEGLSVSEEQFVQCEDDAENQDWSKIFTTPIKQVLDHDHVGFPVKILGRISKYTNPRPVKLGKYRKPGTSVIISIQDEFGTEIKVFPIVDQSLRKLINDDTEKSKKLIFCGTIFPKFVYGKTSLFMFSLHHLIETVTADDLIYLRHEPDERTKKIFEKNNQKPTSIRDYIKKELVTNLGIKGLDKAKELDKCIDFMILQSLSDGYKDNFTMKLHSLVIGPPASGKKLLVDIAKILNPVSEHISAIDGKITVAGLVGKTVYSEDHSESVNGSIPKASGGTLMIEDFHNIKRNRAPIMGAFAEVMEDGTVKDSTSANKKHVANTSIHVDMNKISQVDRSAKVDRHADVNIFSNVISRFDFIMDIPDDRSRQIEVALKMLDGERTFGGYGTSKDDAVDWRRMLKRFIAYYRTLIRQVTIDNATADYISTKFKIILDENQEYMKFTKYFTLQYNATRLVHSIDKLCVASARSRRSIKVEKEDVDIAFSFISEKLKFLAQYEEYLTVPDFTISVDEKVIRQDALRKQFGGLKDVRFSEIQKFIGSLGVKAVHRKTVHDDLKSLKATSKKRAHWNIPK